MAVLYQKPCKDFFYKRTKREKKTKKQTNKKTENKQQNNNDKPTRQKKNKNKAKLKENAGYYIGMTVAMHHAVRVLWLRGTACVCVSLSERRQIRWALDTGLLLEPNTLN